MVIPKSHPKALTRQMIPYLARVRMARSIDASSPGGCWLWKLYKDRKGYGQIKVQGRMLWAHRVAYALWKGDIPPGMTVEHLCRNPPCCNPTHLSLLTIEENTKRGNDCRTNRSCTHCNVSHIPV